MNDNTTGGSTVRHAITGALGTVAAAVAQAYLGTSPEVAVPLGTAASALLGALLRRYFVR